MEVDMPYVVKALGFFVIFSIGASLVVSGISFSAELIDIEGYIAQVQAGNPSLKASRLRADAQHERVAPAGAWDDPFFAVGPDEIPVGGGEGTMLRFQLSQTVPFPGKSGARKRAAELRANSAEADTSVTERSLKVAAHQAYYRLYFNREALKLNSRIRVLLKSTIESTKARYKTGDATHHDWLLARVELSVLEIERLRLEREGRTLLALFNELRDQRVDVEASLAEPDFLKLEAQVDQASADASKLLTDQPELLSLGQIAQASEIEVTLAKLRYAPDFVLQGMAMRAGHGEERSNWGLMVGISLPIYFFNKQSNLLSAANFEKEAASADLKGLENRLRSELSDARQQLATSKDVLLLYRNEVIPSTEVAASNARSAYAAQKLPLSQLLETLRVQRTQSLEFTAAQVDLALSLVRIRELLSSPVVLRLAPSRPTLFSGAGMSSGAMSGMSGMSDGTSGSVRMGSGMSGTTRKRANPGGQSQNGGDGMSGMGGM